MRWTRVPARGLALVIRAYGYAISPLLGAGKCRFHPSCSAYAAEAVERHGALKGSALALKRLLKCHPWHKTCQWDDPVPASIDWRGIIGYKRTRNTPR
ncbi:MAG: membrane protein insertion efficiency factor YidD [Micavibrio aeruginosavorus]|uniref:Putative membrane protein insertion efficiency factor n=1 Tax=Micavibrio aeruginosavorus TaxID=349221 RepID=A0A2W5C3W6_9BACT|nr:MAG: membrane protein insertion efficiency factor YidD [Micavibrio aeruginosavorus]